MLEPMESFWILTEVKDPKQWWGGHIWEDNVSTSKFLYSFLADVSTHSTWYNTSLAKPQELRSFEDYLNPKWKGRIGFSDPRVPSSGQSIWSFMWELRGEEFLKKLVQQDLFLTRDLRQLADALAKGKSGFGVWPRSKSNRTVYQGGTADQTCARDERGTACKQQLRRSRHHQRSAPPQRHQGFYQLVSES